MTEIDAIDTAIDALVALNLDSLNWLSDFYAALIAITVLIDAYSDADIDGLGASCEAEHKKGRDCIGLLITFMTSNYTKRYLQ